MFLLITSLIFHGFSIQKKLLCILKHVEDVKDRSNTPRGCNTMYVKDVENGKRAYTHIFAHNFLNIQLIFNLQKGLSNHTIKYCVY